MKHGYYIILKKEIETETNLTDKTGVKNVLFNI